MENSQYLRGKVLAAEIQVEIQGANMTEYFVFIYFIYLKKLATKKKETNK